MNQSIAQGQARPHGLDRPAPKPGEARKAAESRAKRDPEDVYESKTTQAESVEGVKGAAGNEREDAHEDHLRRGMPGKPPDEDPRHIDVSG